MIVIKKYLGWLSISLLFSVTHVHASDNASSSIKEVLIGLRAIQGNELALQHWQPTAEYLSGQIEGYRFRVVPYDRLDTLLRAAAENKFQFVFTNPSSYVEMQLRYQAKSLATLVNNRHGTAQSRFGSVIFTHAEKPGIASFSDLKGKKLMAVSELAFGGWQIARLEMQRQGFDPYHDLSHLVWGKGNQHNVVYAVRDKRVDAGVVRTDMLERMASDGLIDLRYFRILNPKDTSNFPFFHSTTLYPEWSFAALADTPLPLQLQVKQALVKMPVGHPASTSGHYINWVDSLDYEPVNRLMQELAVGPYQQTAKQDNNAAYWILLLPMVLVFVLLFSRKK